LFCVWNVASSSRGKIQVFGNKVPTIIHQPNGLKRTSNAG
jgi:hypothetical protein